MKYKLTKKIRETLDRFYGISYSKEEEFSEMDIINLFDQIYRTGFYRAIDKVKLEVNKIQNSLRQ